LAGHIVLQRRIGAEECVGRKRELGNLVREYTLEDELAAELHQHQAEAIAAKVICGSGMGNYGKKWGKFFFKL
jgi:hypothetical protein